MKNQNQDWSIEEARTWMKMYLDNYTRQDESVIFKNIAETLGRSYDSAKIRYAEVRRILGGEYDFPIITPNFSQVVQETIESGRVSENKMKIIFE
jgi:tRNA(Met) C34 N-acetyltransferase TmcA